MCDRDRNGNHFFSGLAFGVALGVGVLYFLTSTEKGKKIKREIEDKSEDVVRDLTELVEDMEEKGNEFRKKAMEIKTEIEEKAQDFEGEVLDEAKDKLEQIEKLEDRSRKVAQKVFTRNGKPLSK